MITTVQESEATGMSNAASLERSNSTNDLELYREDTNTDSDPATTSTPPGTSLGVEGIVHEYILTLWGGETVEAESDYVPSTYAKLDSADLATRRRGEFELQVLIELGTRTADDPYHKVLYKSLTDRWSICLQGYGLPSLEDLGQLTREQQDALTKELGLVGQRMKQLEDKCWRQARIYAGKNEEIDRLLQLQLQYYLNAVQNWIKANPDLVVPLSDQSRE